MIDLHSHILPGIDDGSKNDEMSLKMARIAADDGTKILACTSHITPSVYDNNTTIIRRGVARLQGLINAAGIKLVLVPGADIHVTGGMVAKLQSGEYPCLGKSRYFLFEPPHHVAPPNMDRLCGHLMAAGFIPILTHPERLTWIEKQYSIIEDMIDQGIAVQVTGASLTGRFGKRAQYWAKRMIDEGRVDIIASDGHDPVNRPPKLSEAREYVASNWSPELAKQLFRTNPRLILENKTLPAKPKVSKKSSKQDKGLGKLGSWFRKTK